MKLLILYVFALLGALVLADPSALAEVPSFISSGIYNLSPDITFGYSLSFAFGGVCIMNLDPDGGAGNGGDKKPTKEEKDKRRKELEDQINKGDVDLKDEEKLEHLGLVIDEKIDNASKKALEASKEAIEKGEAIEKATKDEIEGLTNQYQELIEAKEASKTEWDGNKEEYEAKFKEMQEQFDELATVADRLPVVGEPKANFQELLEKALNMENVKKLWGGGPRKQYKEILDFGDAKLTILDMAHKAGDMTTANTLTGANFPLHEFVPGIFWDPDTMFTMRSILTVNPTQSNTIQYQQETALDSNVGSVAEGAALAQDDADVATATETVKTIGSYIKVSEELAMDVPSFMAYLQQRLTRKMVVEENRQIIFGDGTANQLTGINDDATAYADGGLNESTDVTPYDVLMNTITQIQDSNTSGEFQPTAILVSPTEFQRLVISKASGDGHYHIQNAVFSPQRLTIVGVPVISTSAMQTAAGVKDTFLVGDFRQASTLWDRMNPSVEMTNTDGSDFINKQLTVRIWERIALTNYRPNAYRTGNMVEALSLGEY